MEEVYKVVKIIDIENIVINAGKENYIKKGDKFDIYTIGEEIKDLDGNSLGTLDTIKETVTVINVFPKMCICQKIVKGSYSTLIKFTQDQLTFKDEIVSLNVDKKELSGGLDEDLTIRIGDLAKLSE